MTPSSGRFTILIGTILLVLRASVPAFAFDVDGYFSGMSVDQLKNLARNRGREAWKIGGNSVWQDWAVGDSKENQIDASIFFCHNHLQSYSHTLDFDTEFWYILRSLLNEHGQPEKVEAEQQVWSGPGGGYFTYTGLSWHVGVDRITLSFNPEGRDSRGNPRYARSANVSYNIADARCL